MSAARPIEPHDLEPARHLIHRTLVGTAYLGRNVELLEEAVSGSDETFGVVVDAGSMIGALGLYGPVVGSRAWRIDALLFAADFPVRDEGATIVDAIVARARAAGSGIVMAEFPADPVMGRALTLLRALGFRQPARIPDYFREGVALLFLRRDL